MPFVHDSEENQNENQNENIQAPVIEEDEHSNHDEDEANEDYSYPERDDYVPQPNVHDQDENAGEHPTGERPIMLWVEEVGRLCEWYVSTSRLGYWDSEAERYVDWHYDPPKTDKDESDELSLPELVYDETSEDESEAKSLPELVRMDEVEVVDGETIREEGFW